MAAVEAEAEWEPAGLLPAPGGGLDWGERGGGGPGAGAGRRGAWGRAGAEAAVSPAEAVLGEELSELLGAAESRRDSRDEPEVREYRAGGRAQPPPPGSGAGGAGGGSPAAALRVSWRPPGLLLAGWSGGGCGPSPARPALAVGVRSGQSPGKLSGSKSRV